LAARREGRCTCNETRRCFRVTVIAVEKAINMACSECVFVALGIQHTMRMRHIVICGLSGSTMFHFFPPSYLINATISEK